MNKVAVYKTNLKQALSELTIAMAKVNRFVKEQESFMKQQNFKNLHKSSIW